MDLIFRVLPDTPAAEAFNALVRQHREAHEHIVAWVAAHAPEAGDRWMVQGGAVTGLPFADPPRGWVPAPEAGYYRLPRDTKRDRARWQSLQSRRYPTGFDVNAAFFGAEWIFRDPGEQRHFLTAGYRRLGDEVYVTADTAHVEQGRPVEGLQEVPASEWAAITQD